MPSSDAAAGRGPARARPPVPEPLTAADRRILRHWIARDKRRGDHRMTLDPVWLERALDALEASEARETRYRRALETIRDMGWAWARGDVTLEDWRRHLEAPDVHP